MKFKCKKCGKEYDAKPEACSCGSVDFEQVEEAKEEGIDLEKYAETIKAELEAELRAKLTKEITDKAIADKKIEEESMKAKLEKELKIKAEDLNKTDADIKMSNLQRLLEEQAETIELLKTTALSQAEQVAQAKVKEAINKRIEKEPHLKNIVTKYLENGTIKTLEDYDNIMTPDLRKALKDKADIEKSVEDLGKDPAGDYKNSSSGNVKEKDWKEKARKEHQEAVNKLFGINRATK